MVNNINILIQSTETELSNLIDIDLTDFTKRQFKLRNFLPNAIIETKTYTTQGKLHVYINSFMISIWKLSILMKKKYLGFYFMTLFYFPNISVYTICLFGNKEHELNNRALHCTCTCILITWRHFFWSSGYRVINRNNHMFRLIVGSHPLVNRFITPWRMPSS